MSQHEQPLGEHSILPMVETQALCIEFCLLISSYMPWWSHRPSGPCGDAPNSLTFKNASAVPSAGLGNPWHQVAVKRGMFAFSEYNTFLFETGCATAYSIAVVFFLFPLSTSNPFSWLPQSKHTCSLQDKTLQPALSGSMVNRKVVDCAHSTYQWAGMGYLSLPSSQMV